MRILRTFLLTAVTCVLGSPVSAQSPCLSQKLIASDAISSGRFGRSVSIDAEWAAIGTEKAAGVPEGAGALYVFHREAGGHWTEHQRLTAPDNVAPNRFGASGVVCGDLIAVSAVYDDDLGPNSGAVYLYHRDPQTNHWVWEAKLHAPDGGGANESFGSSMSLDGGTIAVGTYFLQTRKVHVFHRSAAGVWVADATLVSPTDDRADGFGSVVQLSGDDLAIGAYEYGVGPLQSDEHGALCMFKRNDANGWALDTIIPGRRIDMRFGASLAFSGDRLAIGGATESTTMPSWFNLSIRWFRRDAGGDAWLEEAEYRSPHTSIFVVPGGWMDMDKTTTVKGDFYPFHNAFGTMEVLHEISAGGWHNAGDYFPVMKYSPGCCPDTYGYGTRVAVDDGWIMAADRSDQDLGFNHGAVYTYDANGIDCNANDICDALDISSGASLDANTNGVPDECERTPGDVNGDGLVNVADLLAVITGWGPCSPAPAACPADIAPTPNGDGQVNVADLLMVITNWGS